MVVVGSAVVAVVVGIAALVVGAGAVVSGDSVGYSAVDAEQAATTNSHPHDHPPSPVAVEH